MATMSSKKIMVSSILGNALEFYDFTLYGVLAVVIASHYFPGHDDTANLLFSLAAFAIGFFTRPLGAVVFGQIGDTFGRKGALSLSIFLMGLPTFIIGISPDYQQIGIGASLLVFSCRLLQGIFTGGEYNGAAIFSIEHVGKRLPGFIGGLITGSCVIGALAATLFGAWTQQEGMPQWCWRVPFIFGGFFGIFGYFMRRQMSETPEFALIESRPKTSLLKALLSNIRSSVISFMFGGFNGALTYTLFGYLNIYLSRYQKVPLAEAMQLNIFGLLAFMLGSPLMGYLLDRVGERRFMSTVILSIVAVMFPVFWLLSSGIHERIIIAQIFLGLCTASIAGPGHAVMQRLFPVADRYRGIAFNFSLGMGLFGGITPIVYVQMIERQHISLFFPAFYLMGCALLFGTSLILLKFFSSSKSAKIILNP